MEKWLRGINPSAANSLLEALEEILTLHRLEVPEELRSVLSTTKGFRRVKGFSEIEIVIANIKERRQEIVDKENKKLALQLSSTASSLENFN